MSNNVDGTAVSTVVVKFLLDMEIVTFGVIFGVRLRIA